MTDAIRPRLAIELIAALFAVTALASLAASWVQAEADLDRSLTSVAQQLVETREADTHADTRPGGSAYRVTSLPTGRLRSDLTDRMQAILALRGSSARAMVLDTGPDTLAVALSAPERSFWVISMMKPRPLLSFSPWTIVAWLGLVGLGLGGVSMLLAQRVTASIRLLERFVGAPDGPDGLPPEVPPNGNSESQQVAKLLNALRTRFETTIEARLRVVAMAAHDMRGPLQRMKIRSEFLTDDERRVWLADVEQVEAICDGAIRYVRNREVAEPEIPLQLDEIVVAVVAELRAMLLPVELGRTGKARVLGQPLALRRLLGNLIGNASTHGGGARVSLRVEAGEALIVIDDSGPGIPEELLERVFEPFFRHESDDRPEIVGSGLGLSIARGVAEQMGGSIRLVNRLEGGLRQELRLPVPEVETV